MAEGFVRTLSDVEAHSAGTRPGRVHPLAVEVMREVGVDIARQRPKPVEGYLSQAFDYVITMCESANRERPVMLPSPGNQSRTRGTGRGHGAAFGGILPHGEHPRR